jgi:hypothetical protein
MIELLFGFSVKLNISLGQKSNNLRTYKTSNPRKERSNSPLDPAQKSNLNLFLFNLLLLLSRFLALSFAIGPGLSFRLIPNFKFVPIESVNQAE